MFDLYTRPEPQDCYFATSDADYAEMCEINAELNDEFFGYFDETFDEHDDYYGG